MTRDHMRDMIMAMVRAEPGDLTPDDVAQDLGLARGEVRRACGRLRERGDLLPSGYRVYPHTRERIADGRVTREDYGGLVLLIAEIGPCTRSELAARRGAADLCGADRELLRDLELFGYIAGPSKLWSKS